VLSPGPWSPGPMAFDWFVVGHVTPRLGKRIQEQSRSGVCLCGMLHAWFHSLSIFVNTFSYSGYFTWMPGFDVLILALALVKRTYLHLHCPVLLRLYGCTSLGGWHAIRTVQDLPGHVAGNRKSRPLRVRRINEHTPGRFNSPPGQSRVIVLSHL
jgi:hypothetical protein